MAPTPELDLAAATRAAIAAHPEGLEAGPKALLTAVQEANAEFADVGFQKFKKIAAKVKIEMKEEEEAARIEAAKPKVGSVSNCPGRHGLKRFLTNHSSYCCDTCRCYIAEGKPMWGCRECDWDVCEGRCHPASVTLPDLQANAASLQNQVEQLCSERPQDMRTKLALVESEVQKFEKALDNASVQDIVKFSAVTLSEDEARNGKKALIKGSEELLSKIEKLFAELALDAPDASREVPAETE